MIPPESWPAPWTSTDATTRHQSELAESDLEKWVDGAPHVSFDAFRKLLTPILADFESLLEIGAGCGYYSQVLYNIDPKKIYVGCDISSHMVAYAKERWKPRVFIECPADALWAEDSSFDVTCPSAVLQHMPDYRPAIKEALRVSKRFVLIHRVQATTGPTNEFINPAYGTALPTREINEQEFLAFCGLVGLALRQREEWGGSLTRWNASYLMEKT